MADMSMPQRRAVPAIYWPRRLSEVGWLSAAEVLGAGGG
eukprot:SAG25_NODE_14103_length_259_cov_0.637500_1_plen_38_part_10